MTEEAILDLVSKAFQSLWPMELLVLLSQEPQRIWQIGDLARELRATNPVVIQALAALQAAGFVAVDAAQAYRFHAANPDLAELARELLDLYDRKPRTVMRAIFAAPRNRIQTFADAFRLRKDTC